MTKFLSWLSTKSLAHLFAITRHLEAEVARLRKENKALLQELADQRQESIQKIYQAVGLHQPDPYQNTEGVPLEVFHTQVKSVNPVSDLVRRAEEEDWVKWQEEERQRLAAAQLNHTDFHDLTY